MSVLIFVSVVISGLASAQDYFDSDNDYDSNGAKSYGNSSNCIRRYRDLQSYVLNNEDLMDDLSELFFETGKTPTEFVRITYRFTTDNSTDSTNNDTRYYNDDDNDDDDDDDDDGKFICINDQKKFIWSSSALYLLGPKPLFWLTLFAVHVRESSININLPCLCSDVYDDLLSQLTYLVSVHKLLNLFI